MRPLLPKLSLLTAAALLLGAAAKAPAPGAAWLTDVNAALAEAERSDRFILVDLYAEWCGWCKKLEKQVFADPAFEPYARRFVLLRVDTEDGGQGTRLAERFGVGSLPTTLLIDHHRARVGEIEGFAPVERFLPLIDREVAAWQELEQGYAKFGKSDDPEVLRVLARTFHERADVRAAELYRRLLDGGSLAPEEATWTRYRMIDALRLGGEYDRAAEELDRARRAAGSDDRDLVERLELIAVDLARERGDCASAVAGLESFLSEHPESQLRRLAARTLEILRSEGTECT